MTIHFGNDFDGAVFTPAPTALAGELYAGPNKLLQWLEHQLGLTGYPANAEYLRIELYRQALGQVTGSFYAMSFEADRFATAAYLLRWRDELLLSGWDFYPQPGMPPRLKTLAEVEEHFQKKLADPELGAAAKGFADRFAQVLHGITLLPIAVSSIYLYEPEALQKPVVKRLLTLLRSQASSLVIEEVKPPADSLSADKQMVVLRCRRDSDAATFLAQLLRENPELKPTFLAPQPSLALEQSLLMEGFPAMGIQSASLARPSLQVLKLAPAFLWEPVDVFKIMEFLTLPLKPLDAGLALEIARVMAEKPGFFSDTWFAAVYGYLEQLDAPEKVREQYNFWFDRRRYPADKTAPKRDAEVLYSYLRQWANNYYEETGSTNNSLLVLAEQARRIQELLEALPEQRISYLELERIVRTIFEASPIQLAPSEKGSFAYVHKPGAVASSVDTLVWWNFIDQQEAPPPEKWQHTERIWLGNQGVTLQTARDYSQLQQYLMWKPLLWTTRQLWFVVPDQADGAEVQPNLLMSDLAVALGDHFLENVYHIDQEQDCLRLKQLWRTSADTTLPVRGNQRPRPHLWLAHPDQITTAAYETPTNLESLFYYPHRWFFRQKLRLYPSSLLTVTGDNTLLGSLAHRFFENLLKEDLASFDRTAVYQWVQEQANTLLPREGATLLLYGREPERNAFLNRVKNAAWSLVSLLRSNGWSVTQTEMTLEGFLGDMPVRGKADLVLSRGNEMAIVDLKWSGSRRRKELIMNGEDLQLVLYGKLLPPDDQWPHTAYFILEEGKIIARNAQAFKESVVAGRGADDHCSICDNIFDKMCKTHTWRMDQINRGMVELRTARNAAELESMYEGQLSALLEMKLEDALWDDYRTLLGI